MKLVRWLALCLISLMITLWLGSCSSTPSQKAVSLYVGAAGVFRDALLEVDKLYQQEAPHVVNSFAFAGTALIQQKIDQGEPFDLFIAAYSEPMNVLQAKRDIFLESRKLFFGNQVALIVPKDSPLGIREFKDLTSDRIKTVAIPIEKVAPGIFAKDVLTNLGIWAALQPKIRLANLDLREVLKAVENKEVDAGITFLTESKLSDKVKVAAIAPSNLHRPFEGSLAILKQSNQVEESKKLIDFLTSPKAAAVFEKYGFSVIPTTATSKL